MKTILYHSFEHICYHEAGHVLAAFNAGALVVIAEIFEHGVNDYSGRTTAKFDEHAQSMIIAAGGLASELFLYDNGLLLGAGGDALSHDDFMKAALHSARDDIDNFLSASAAGTADDRPFGTVGGFIQFAEIHRDTIDLELLEKFAQVLIAQRKIESTTFGKIVANHKPN